MERHPAVLVTGGGGQVGRALGALLPHARALSREELDVTDGAAVSEAVSGSDHVVHLAALTNVDRCETDPQRAHEINVQGTQNIVHAAEQARARVIFLSTDYVFDGLSGNPYKEDDPRSPLNVYGMTKAEAEDIVADELAGLTIRASWVFGDGHNFVASILAAARRGSPLRVVDDQRGIPTPAEAIARAIVFAIDQRLEGLVHVAGDGPIVSWADLAQAALERAGMDVIVERVTTDEYMAGVDKTVARRPAFSALDLTKATRLGIPLLDWRTALDDYVERSQ